MRAAMNFKSLNMEESTLAALGTPSLPCLALPSLPSYSCLLQSLLKPLSIRREESPTTDTVPGAPDLLCSNQGYTEKLHRESGLARGQWCVGLPLPSSVPRLMGNTWGDQARRGNPSAPIAAAVPG